MAASFEIATNRNLLKKHGQKVMAISVSAHTHTHTPNVDIFYTVRWVDLKFSDQCIELISAAPQSFGQCEVSESCSCI